MKKFLKKRHLNEEMALQITSMADIFTILLVFLLKSYSTNLTTLAPTAEMTLPEAHAEEVKKEASKLEIAADSISIDDKVVVTLKDFQFTADDLKKSGTSSTLYGALMTERKKQTLVASDSSMLIMADERTPYSTVKRVLASLADTGFVDLNLVVVKAE